MDQSMVELEDEAEQIVKDIGIPPCPAVLTKLLQEMREEEPDFFKLGNLIGRDISLAAAMLKTVNSPFYGLRTKATSVHQAIALLGSRNVAELVTGLLLRDAFPGGTSDLMDEFWEYSSGIAQISANLAQKFRCVDHNAAYTFALFRDCGMLAMMGSFKSYKPVFAGAEEAAGTEITGREDESHGMNHAWVGCLMAETWLLPDEICKAVLWHHNYSAVQDGRVDLPVASAKYIALALVAESIYVKKKLGIDSADWRKNGALALQQLGLTEDNIDAAAEVFNL